MKRKFPFLLDYTDTFIRETGIHILIKAETASRKLLDMDRNKKAEDKLYSNREILTTASIQVSSGQDNRLDSGHPPCCQMPARCYLLRCQAVATCQVGDGGQGPSGPLNI